MPSVCYSYRIHGCEVKQESSDDPPCPLVGSSVQIGVYSICGCNFIRFCELRSGFGAVPLGSSDIPK